MDRTEMENFAVRWIAHWNDRDLEAVLAPFADHARFISPLAAEVTVVAVVEGRDALRTHWANALGASRSLRFTLLSAVCDVERQILLVHYLAERNGKTTRAAEAMRFENGRQVEGESFYGAPASGGGACPS